MFSFHLSFDASNWFSIAHSEKGILPKLWECGEVQIKFWALIVELRTVIMCLRSATANRTTISEVNEFWSYFIRIPRLYRVIRYRKIVMNEHHKHVTKCIPFYELIRYNKLLFRLYEWFYSQSALFPDDFQWYRLQPFSWYYADWTNRWSPIVLAVPML